MAFPVCWGEAADGTEIDRGASDGALEKSDPFLQRTRTSKFFVDPYGWNTMD